jgi:hypothetical protein
MPPLRRSDTLMQHQSDPRHRSNFIPTPGQDDDTNRADLAERTARVDVTGAANGCYFVRPGSIFRISQNCCNLLLLRGSA